MQFLAIDWSGRASGAAEAIWLARVREGRLVELDNGRERDAVVDRAIQLAGEAERTFLGLDFAFSFPAWWCAANGWAGGPRAWEAMRADGERILAACEPPFWGRAGTTAQTMGVALRETEAAAAPAKSVFQIGGAGAVGTGSLRGMPQLGRLRAAGFAIWPFDAADGPRVALEIYPRLLTGPVVKTRHRDRGAFLADRFPEQDAVLLERAAGSEDAFDAAVSALAMAHHAQELAALAPARTDVERIEGRIWRPAGPALV